MTSIISETHIHDQYYLRNNTDTSPVLSQKQHRYITSFITKHRYMTRFISETHIHDQYYFRNNTYTWPVLSQKHIYMTSIISETQIH